MSEIEKIQKMYNEGIFELSEVYFGKNDKRLTAIFDDYMEDMFEEYNINIINYNMLETLHQWNNSIKEIVYQEQLILCRECEYYNIIDIDNVYNYIIKNNTFYGISCGCALEVEKESVIENDYTEINSLLYDKEFEEWLKSEEFELIEEGVDANWSNASKFYPKEYTKKYNDKQIAVGITCVHQFGGTYDIWIKDIK